MNDRELLNLYLADRDERAFAELVRRHVDMVYSAARRQVKDSAAAHDVTQHVFASLAQKGGTIRDCEALAGWLLTSTRFAALDWLRAEARRRHHENKAAAMKQELFGDSPDAAADWESIQPVLDEAMSQLRPRDRDALALRYFRNLNLAEVARELGITTDAANKRIERATERLRKLFARRGVTTTGQMLSGALVIHAVASAPVELAGQIAQQAVAMNVTTGAAAGASLTTTKGAVLLMAATKTQVGIAAGVVIALAAVTVPVVYLSLPERSAVPTTMTAIDRPPQPQPTMPPAASADSQRRLNDVYSLAAAQNAKRVPPPFIPERDQALTRNGQVSPLPLRMDSAAVFRWDGRTAQFKTWVLGGNMTLGDALEAVTGIWKMDTDIPRDLLLTPIPGDWAVREETTTQERLIDFLRGVDDVIGPGMFLRQEPMEREVIVVRGTIELDRMRREQGSGYSITIAEGPGRQYGWTAPSPREMLKILGESMARPVVIEADVDVQGTSILVHTQRSANFNASIEVPAGEVIDPCLARVAEQTGLELKRERRMVPTWRLVPAGL